MPFNKCIFCGFEDYTTSPPIKNYVCDECINDEKKSETMLDEIYQENF